MFTLALVWKFYASPWSVLDVRIAIFFVGQQKRTDLISPRLDFTWGNPGTRCCPSLIENGILSFEREKIQTHVAVLYFLKKEATHLYGEKLTNIIVTNSKGKRWDLTWSNPGTHCCLSRTPATHISYISGSYFSWKIPLPDRVPRSIPCRARLPAWCCYTPLEDRPGLLVIGLSFVPSCLLSDMSWL